MRQQPRLSNMSKREILKYREIKDSISRGRIPVWLLNPTIIDSHNKMSPQVAQLTSLDEVSLDMLAVLVSGDMDTGIEARKFSKYLLNSQPSKAVEPDLPIRHDPAQTKLHMTLDELED